MAFAVSDGSAPLGPVIRTVVGLVLLLGLAYLGAHPRVRVWEERLGISQLLTTGLPFVGLGLIARAPGVEILTPSLLADLSPLLQVGLGWIGLLTGFSFRLGTPEEPPRGVSGLLLTILGLPSLLIGLSCGAILYAVDVEITPSVLARDAMLVGLAGALAAPSMAEAVQRMGLGAEAVMHARRLAKFEAVAAVAGLAVVGAYYRPGGENLTWQLPGTGWLFVTVGIAGTLGVLGWLMMRRPLPKADANTLLLGTVAFAAGMAGYLSLSALVVSFLAGIALRNLPGAHYEGLVAALQGLERPVYLLFLVVVGALWDADDWRGWALLAPFVIARLAGRWAGVWIARRTDLDPRGEELFASAPAALIVAPTSPLAIAMIVSVATLYRSPGVRLLVTPVIGGAMVFEVLVHILGGRRRKPVA